MDVDVDVVHGEVDDVTDGHISPLCLYLFWMCMLMLVR